MSVMFRQIAYGKVDNFIFFLLFTSSAMISEYFNNNKIKAVSKADSLPGGRFD